MGGEEDAVFGGRAALGSGSEEFLDAVDLAMQKWRYPFIVGRDCHWGEAFPGQDGSTKDFTTGRDSSVGQWYDSIFGDVEDDGYQRA